MTRNDTPESRGMQTDPIPWPVVRQVNVMGVRYSHCVLPNGDDLYLTRHGLRFADLLDPDHYHLDESWVRGHREQLNGTSAIYRIRTKPVDGRSIDIVLKWNRVAQDVPGATAAEDPALAEFNSPFEEFSLMLELRGSQPNRILTHKPLAIYVPSKPVDWDRTGRRRYRFEAKQMTHADVRLHDNRMYAVIYEWIKGVDAAQAFQRGLISREEMGSLTIAAGNSMRINGYLVQDNKPNHIIVRPHHDNVRRNRTGEPLWAYVDFELLQRTPEQEQAIRQAKRKVYLTKQASRFRTQVQFPPHLKSVNILGVDYVYGRIESTNGALWVVGRDPDLFDYFLPEKWRKMPRTRMSMSQQVYETTTKDNVRLVWRLSGVGRRPDMDPFRPDEKRILDFGYNSPFEEVALAIKLSTKGIGAIYPRAIYMTGGEVEVSSRVSDDRRYETHDSLRTPEGEPILRQGREYIIIWGYWNGPDELLAVEDDPPYTSISALEAYWEGLVDQPMYIQLIEKAKRRLAEIGIEDLNLRGTHLMLSLKKSGGLEMDLDGLPMVLICNFELLCEESYPIWGSGV